MMRLRLVLPALSALLLAIGMIAVTNGCGGAGFDDDEGDDVTVSVSPSAKTLAPSATQQFAATVTGSENTAVAWTVDEAGGGAVTSGGLYTAPAAAGTYHVRATSQAHPSVSGAATVTVSGGGGGVTVTVSPKTASLAPSASQQFTATVTGSANTAVAWTVDEAGGGAVTTGGLYTAPAAAGTYHVRATSQASPSASDVATVTVTGGGGGVTVTISPKTVSLATLATQQFTATVTGSANTAVAWTVDEAGGGAVTTGGRYTAPAAAGTYHVRATSQANPSVSDVATVTVTGGGGGGGPALLLSIDSTIVEVGSTKAGTLTKVELLDTTGAVLKTAAINGGTASIDMTGLVAGHYFMRVNDLADDLVPTKIDNPNVQMVQAVGPKLRITRIGAASSPTYRIVSYSRGQGMRNVVKYSDGSNAVPQSYAYGVLYLKTSPMKIEVRTLGFATLLTSYTNAGPHSFSSWTMSGGSSKPHGDPTIYTSDRACSCHGNLDSKPASYNTIGESNGWCYKCHYGKTGFVNGFVHPGQ